METKFKINDRVKITNHENKKYIGKEGTIKSTVIIVDSFDDIIEEHNQGLGQAWTIRTDKTGNSTGFYQIVLNGYKTPLKGYATDNDLIEITW